MTDEQSHLRQGIRRAVADHGGARAFADAGTAPTMNRELWKVLTGQIGLAALLVPEADGGMGATISDAAVVFEELGASLAPVPALSTVGLGTTSLLVAPDPEADKLLGKIAAAGTVVGFAVADLTDPWAGLEVPSVRSEGTADQRRLSGQLPCVLDGAVAEILLVPSLGPDGVEVCAVEAKTPGLRVDALESLDLTRGLAAVDLEGAEAGVVIGAHGCGVLGTAFDLALVLLCAEQVGLARRCHERAVEYAKKRVQFGRPIGSFQAIKHLLVDLLLDIELASSAAIHAALVADNYLEDRHEDTARDLRVAASMAAGMCKETAMRVARESLHVFGGVGFTWEHDAHLYFRRAKSAELLLGPPAWHRTRGVATLRGLA